MSNKYIKTEEELALIKESGKAHKMLIEHLADFIKEKSKELPQKSFTTYEIEEEAEAFCKKNNVIPTQVGYEGYPYVICCGINSDSVHTMPHKEKKIKLGDMVNIDTTVTVNGYMADGGFTIGIGEIDKTAKTLIETSKNAFYNAISIIKNGVDTKDISKKIYYTAREHGFDVLRNYAGHGIGKKMHEDPYILNYPSDWCSEKISTNTVLAMDILIVENSPKITILRDGWSTKLKDDGRFSFYEKTIIVKEKGVEIVNDFKI